MIGVSVRPSVCPSVRASVRPVRTEWLSPLYSTYWCYLHQTCTNCSSWHDLLMPGGGLCPWPIFHTWVIMVRKKWLSPYYSSYWYYIHQTWTNCSSWHDLLMPCGGLCPWPTFHAWVTMVRKKWLGPYYSTYCLLVLHSPNLYQLFILTWSTDAT